MRQDNLSIEQRAIRVTIVVLTAALLVWLSYQLRIVIIDVLLAVIIASAIAPVADRGEKHRIPRALTVVIVYVGVALFYTGVGLALAKPLTEQADLFKQHLPQYREQVGSFYEKWKADVDDYANHYFGIDIFDDVHADSPEAVIAPILAPEAAVKVVTENAPPSTFNLPVTEPTPAPAARSAKKPRKVEPGQLQDVVTRVARETLTVTAGLFGALLNAVLVLFLTAYFVVEAPHIWKSLILWVPPANRERAQSLIEPLGYRMGGYVRGQMVVSTAVAFVFGIGFSVINLQYSFVLAIMAGLFNLIPFVGSMMITVLAILIAANTGGPVLVALTIVVFAIEQFLESNFIVPHLLGKQVDMHPLLVLLAILIGGTLAGALGAIVAVPVASALLFLAQEFYVKPINEPAS
jgi:predicted PurR-regulated permease PerM